MANVLNRTSLDYFESVNTPDYDPAQWLINPDLSALVGIPVAHWKVEGDAVLAMTAEEIADAARIAPYRGLDLADAKSLKQTMVNAFRDQHMDGGWIYQGIWYDSNAAARQNMAGTMTLITSGYTLPDTFTWRAQDNTNHAFDNNSFVAFYRCSCIWMEMIYHTSWDHKAVIDGLDTIDDVINYDLNKNWPNGVD